MLACQIESSRFLGKMPICKSRTWNIWWLLHSDAIIWQDKLHHVTFLDNNFSQTWQIKQLADLFTNIMASSLSCERGTAGHPLSVISALISMNNFFCLLGHTYLMVSEEISLPYCWVSSGQLQVIHVRWLVRNPRTDRAKVFTCTRVVRS